MIVYDYADAKKSMEQALLHHLDDWQKGHKAHAKFLNRIGKSTEVVDAELRVLADVVNQINAIRDIKRTIAHRSQEAGLSHGGYCRVFGYARHQPEKPS